MSRKQCGPPCEHTVEAGDTFSALAGAYYGDGSGDVLAFLEK